MTNALSTRTRANSSPAQMPALVTVQRFPTSAEWREGLPALPKKGPSVQAELRQHYPGLLRAVSSTQVDQWQACFDYGARRTAVHDRRAKLQSYYRRRYGEVWEQHPHYLKESRRLDRLEPDRPDVMSATIKVSALFSDDLDLEPDWDVKATMDFRGWARKEIGDDEIDLDFAYSDHDKGFARDPLLKAPTHSKGIIGVKELERYFAKEYREQVTHRPMIKELGEALEKIDSLRSDLEAEHRHRHRVNAEQPMVRFIAESLGYWSTGELADEPPLAMWTGPKRYLLLSRTAYRGRQIELLVPLLLRAQEGTRSCAGRFVSYETHVMKGAGSAVTILGAAKWAGALAAGALTGGTSLVGSALAAGGYTLAQEGAQQASEVHHGLRSKLAPGDLAKQAGTSAVLALVGGSLQKKFTDALRVRVPSGITNPRVRELLASGAAAGVSSTYTTAVQVGLDKALSSASAPQSAEEFADLIVKNAVTSVLVDAGMRGTNARIAQEFAALRAGLPRGALLPEPAPGARRTKAEPILKIDAIRRLLVKSGGWTRLRKELVSGTGLGRGLTKFESQTLIHEFEAHQTHFAIESAELFGGRVVRDVADPWKPLEVHFDGPDGPGRAVQAKHYLDKARPGWSQAGVKLVIGSSSPLSKAALTKEHLHYALGHEVGPMTARFEKVYFQWDTLTAQGRLEAVARIANGPLVEAGYPPLTPKMIKSGSLNGQANPAEWTLEINASLLQGSAVEVNRFARLADTAAHEGRHGLQIIRAARLDPSGNVKNGLRHDIATLLTTGTYKGKTLEALTPGTEARADAQKFFDSLMGGGAAHRTQVYDRMDDARSKMKDLWTQIETARKSPTSTRSAKVKLMAQLHAEHQRLIQAHRDYKALPEESDAWRYGGEVGVSVSRSLKRRFGKLAEQNDRHSTTMSQALARQQAILSGLGGARVTGGLTGIQLDKFEKTLDKYFAALSRAQKVNAKSRALWEKVHSDTRSADESL